MNKPVAWIGKNELQFGFTDTRVTNEKESWDDIPLYTHPVINNGGNLEELNTKVQDASTSLESTPPINAEPVGRYYWESVVDGHFMAVPSEGTIHYEIDDFPLYLHPVKELTNEVYFCSRCGKRLGDGIHTCTPPADILRKAQEK